MIKISKTAASSDTLDCMKRAFVVSTVTKLAPFQWLPYEQAPRGVASHWEILVWWFHFLMMFIYVVHLSLRSWITYHDAAIQEWKKLYCLFITIHMSHCLWLYTAISLNPEGLPNFMGRHIRFFQSTTAKALLPDTTNGFVTKNSLSFVKALRQALYTNGLLIGLLCLVTPSLPDLWVAWFLKPNESVTCLDMLPWTPIQAYYGLSYANWGVLYSCCNFCFIFPTLNMLKCMRLLLASNNGGWTNLMVRMKLGSLPDQRLLKIYRELYLLVEEFNSVYGIIMIASKVTFIATGVFCTYGALRLDGMVAGFLGFAGLTIMILFAAIMVTMGEVNHASKLFLRRIQSRYGYRKWYGKDYIPSWYLAKSLKSTQELKLRVGSTYFIDKGIALTTFRITLDNTINFLLASK